MTALGRLAAFLLEPASPAAAAMLPAACRAAVLGTPRDVPPLAAALALTLRAADRSPAALVAVWGASVPAAAPAVRAAKRLAAAAGDASAARGRLAWLALAPEPEHAVEALVEAAAVVGAPLVTALGGPRPPALEALVSGHDLVVVAAAPGTRLAEAATARLAERGVPAVACRPLARGAVRALATAGLATPRLDLAATGLAAPRLELAAGRREAR